MVIPTRNEESSIGRVIDEVAASLRGREAEVLVVDTDSRDRTVAIAQARGARVIREPRRGYGRAYKTGFAAARGAFVVTLDADFTYPASRIPDLLAPVERGEADLVSADRLSRVTEEAMSGMHRLGNGMLNLAFQILYRHPIRDSQSGMWAFRRDILSRLDLVSDGMPFSEEFKLEVLVRGLRHMEVPVDYRPRVGSKKIRSVRDAALNMVWLFRKRFRWARGA